MGRPSTRCPRKNQSPFLHRIRREEKPYSSALPIRLRLLSIPFQPPSLSSPRAAAATSPLRRGKSQRKAMADDFPFGLPENVPERYDIPPGMADTVMRRRFAKLLGKTGEHINIVLQLLNDDYARDMFRSGDAGQVEANKKTVRQKVNIIHQALMGGQVFPMPAVLIAALGVLNIEWPPQQNGAAQPQQNGAAQPQQNNGDALPNVQ